jgi:hypothetical protein
MVEHTECTNNEHTERTNSQFLDVMGKLEGTQIDKIYALEALNTPSPENGMQPITPPLNHHHCDDLYAREIFMPKGTVATGRVHLLDHINVISMGVVTVVTPTETVKYEAPITFVGKKGTKRALYCHEDTIWTTIHLSHGVTDLDVLEKGLTTNEREICERLNIHTKKLETLEVTK